MDERGKNAPVHPGGRIMDGADFQRPPSLSRGRSFRWSRLDSQHGHQAEITEAIRRQANDFRTDGGGAAQLPFPVVSLHIDFPAAGHPKMASDKDVVFAELVLTDYCKALSRAFCADNDFHNYMIFKRLRARGGFSSTPSDFWQKNRAFISDENKYPVILAREFAFSQYI